MDGCHKIGMSTDPARRLKDFPLMPSVAGVVAAVPTPDMAWLESYLHKAFADRRERGEWFRLTPVDVAAMAGIKAVDTEADLPPQVIESYRKNFAIRKPSGRSRPGGPGRPPADPVAGPLERVVTKLTQVEQSHLVTKYGSIYKGLRILARQAMEEGC